MAKMHLERLEIPYVYQEINEPSKFHYHTRDLFHKFSPAKMRTTPRIFINGEDLKGASDLKKLGDDVIRAKVNGE